MYSKIVCIVAWILRFTNNCRRVHVNKTQELSAKEITKAELFLCRLAQKESFLENDSRLRSLNVFEENGLIRIKTITSNRQDTFSFMSYSIGFNSFIDVENYLSHSSKTYSCWY